MARRATIKLELEGAGEVRAELERTGQSLDELEIEAVEAGDGFSRLSDEAQTELADTRAQAARTAASMNQMSATTSGTANALGMELTQAAQDASFGVAGVANQLPQLQREFQRLQDQTGSTVGALSSLGSTFIGPTGLLAAGTLLLNFWPKIVSAFDSAGAAAEEATEKVEGLASATGSVVKVTSDQIRDLELSLNKVDQAVATTESRIGDLQTRIKALQAIRGAIPEALEAEIPLDQIGVVVQQIRDTSLTLADLREARQEGEEELRALLEDRLSVTREELNTEKGVKQNLSDQQQELERQLRAQERVRELGAERSENESDTADDATNTANELERAASAMNALRGPGPFQVARNEELVRRFLQQQQQGPLQLQIQTTFQPQNTPTVGGVMMRRGQPPAARALRAARDAGLISEFQSFQELLSQLEQQSDQTFTAAQLGAQTATSAMNALTQSMIRGESAAEGLRRTFGQLLSQVGSTLLQTAITGGSALGLAGGPLAALGIGGGLLGGLVGAFEHGGRVHTPLQIVGEAGPELAALPQGTQVHSNRETQKIFQGGGASGRSDMQPVIQKLDGMMRRIEQIEMVFDPYAVESELADVRSEKQTFDTRT